MYSREFRELGKRLAKDGLSNGATDKSWMLWSPYASSFGCVELDGNMRPKGSEESFDFVHGVRCIVGYEMVSAHYFVLLLFPPSTRRFHFPLTSMLFSGRARFSFICHQLDAHICTSGVGLATARLIVAAWTWSLLALRALSASSLMAHRTAEALTYAFSARVWVRY